MFIALATRLVVLLYCCATADILTNFYGNASCFSLQCFLFFIVVVIHGGNSQVSVYRTIGPTLVSLLAHLSQRLIGDLIGYPWSGVCHRPSVHNFKRHL